MNTSPNILPMIVEVISNDPVWYQAAIGFGSAIIGAVAAFFPSWYLAQYSHKKSLERDVNLEKRDNRVATLSLVTKVGEVVDDIFNLNKAFTAQLEYARSKERYKQNPFLGILPTVGHANQKMLVISDKEISVVSDFGSPDTLMSLMLLKRRYTSIFKSFEEFNRSRNEWDKFIGAPDTFDGKSGSKELQGARAIEAKVLAKKLNDLVIGISKHLTFDTQISKDVMSGLQDIGKKTLNPKFQFELPEDLQ